MKHIIKYGLTIISGFAVGCVYCCFIYKIMEDRDLANAIDEMSTWHERALHDECLGD